MNSIVEKIFYYAKICPDKAILIVDDERVTYSQFRDLIISNSVYFKKIGLKPKDIVVIMAGAKLSFVTSIFAIHLCGAISAPLEKSIPQAAFEAIRDDLKASISIINYKSNNETFIYSEDMLEIVRATELTDKDRDEVVFPKPNETGDILFTTGTTGASKGIELTHRNIVAAAENILGFVNAEPDNINLIPAPLNHSFGIRRMYANFINGTTVVLLDGLTPIKKFFKAIDTYKVTSITMVSSAFDFIFKMSKDKLGEYKDQLKYIDIGAQSSPNSLKTKLIELLPSSRLYNLYGSTEAGIVSGLDFNSHPDKIDSIGLDAVNASIFFVDENKKEILANNISSTGLLTISGSVVMKGYINDPELTKETLIDGCVYTNDIGYRDEDGYIFLLGRKGDVINVGGNKVSPEEVEEVANRHETVVECACVAYKDENAIIKEVPKLFVVPVNNEEFSHEDLRTFLSTYLENYKVPKLYEVIEELPRTFNGKIQRNRLQK